MSDSNFNIIDKSKKFLIVGLGLLGGSYSMSLKESGYRVSAITKNQEDIDFAIEKGYIDSGSTEPTKENVGDADIIVFALYPHVFTEWIDKYQHLIKPGAVLTDVTGVKGCIVYDIQSKLRPDIEFISAHPMAGREVSGVQNSDSRIFREANYIVVPTEKNTKEAIKLCEDLGYTLHFHKIVTLTPEEHDEMIAFLSQLTHCIAVSLMCANENDRLAEYTGDSFRDLTRIGKINDEMWSELFLLNKKPLLKEMDAFLEVFGKLRSTIESGDRETMRSLMRKSTERRKLFDKKL